MKVDNFWYVAAESHELKSSKPLHRQILNEWLVLFRDENNKAVALQDRCLHRSVRLSGGQVKCGKLRCSYHGWTYDNTGKVVHVPSEGPSSGQRERYAINYDVIEQDDFIYVCLNNRSHDIKPFPMPYYKTKGYTTIRLQNLFENNVTNCAENFVDIPHTTFVHPGIFRNPSEEKLKAHVVRKNGSVKVTYYGEKKNFGIFSWFLNRKGEEIKHTDEFFMPNITTVNYWFGKKHFIITSQSVPISNHRTLVYTDLTYNYGIWNLLSRPIVRRQGQMIINQDIDILGLQMQTIEKYGVNFQNSPADIIHTFIESIQKEISENRNPTELPDKEAQIEFYI